MLPALLVNISLYAGIRVGRWKGQYQLNTYSKIAAFEKNKVLDENEQQQHVHKDRIALMIIMLLFTIGACGFALIGFWLVE